MDELLGDAVRALEASMAFRVARQSVLAANVANADTPGYRRVDLSFESRLAETGSRLVATHARHLHSGTGPHGDYRLEIGPRGERPDRNGVGFHREILEMSRNAGAFTDQAAVLARLLAIQRIAISGEPRSRGRFSLFAKSGCGCRAGGPMIAPPSGSPRCRP